VTASDIPDSSHAAAVSTAPLNHEIQRRRTFAIISHPDAGKTTLTEKLLLYGGAVHLAGSVKARRAARHATSDWMALEQERGISVTSSVLQFEYDGLRVNLLDTPGHEDFSEDTYRTLVAADSAVMLLDNRKGVEEQTRKLFAVCRRRRMPIFTFVNKCDRRGEDPLRLLDEVSAELELDCFAVTWPLFRGDAFVGVFDRLASSLHLFQRAGDHGQRRVEARLGGIEDPALVDLLGAESLAALRDELALLDAVGPAFDPAAVAAGTLSPTFFGSALTNFGVEPFLHRFLELAPSPLPRVSSAGPIEPGASFFSAFVFKIQANMDARHRDRIAFLRVCSGRFEPGLTVQNVRTDSAIRLARPQQFLARERRSLDVAWAGDIVGIHDRGSLRIGDTLTDAPATFEFAGIPRFSPEHFARLSVPDPLRRKHLDTGLRQLAEEGTVQVFFEESAGGPVPIVGAVGRLQFDVLVHRLENEYGVVARLHSLPFRHARWVEGDDDAIDRLRGAHGLMRVFDASGRPLVLFADEFALRHATREAGQLRFHDVAV
jgi:peptide chain release factor 3